MKNLHFSKGTFQKKRRELIIIKKDKENPVWVVE